MVTPEETARHFPIDLYATAPVHVDGLGEGSRLYEVTSSSLIPDDADVGRAYIMDTSAGGIVACHPHIVGETLRTHCLEAAAEFVRAAEALGLLEPDDAAILHILRAGAGYMVADAVPGVPVIDVRTEYRADGYREHSDDPRDLVVSYRHYPAALGESGSLVVPDTYATGRSAEAALLDLFRNGFAAERVILYGFIAIPALARVGALCRRLGVDLYSFAICDLTQLAHNNYDMCIYGQDESLFKAEGRRGLLGSVIDRKTLERLLPHYVPGLDQPGDWSERQTNLFDGYSNRSGDIRGHLEKSIGLIESLMSLNSGHEWYTEAQEEAAEKELGLLRATLGNYP